MCIRDSLCPSLFFSGSFESRPEAVKVKPSFFLIHSHITLYPVSYTHLDVYKRQPLLSLLLIGAVVLAGGGIGYYFKIYKPKHEAPDLEDDYCEYEDGELEEISEEPDDEDTPPWEEDTEE